MPKFKMPPREEGDGSVRISRTHPSGIAVDVITHETKETIHMSEYNACRVFGLLAFTLGISLPPELGRAIKL